MKPKTILLPLKRQFSILLTVFIIFTVSIVLYSTYDYYHLQTMILDESLTSYSAQLAKSTRQSYESYENICYNVAYNQTIQKYLESDSSSDRYAQYQPLYSLLTNMANLNSYIIDIAIYGSQNTFAALNGAAETYAPFARNLPESRFPFQAVGTTSVNQVDCHIMAMPIYTLSSGDSRYLGVMFLAIDTASMFDNNLSHQMEYDPKIIFTDPNGDLVFGDSMLHNHLPDEEIIEDHFLMTVGTVSYSVNRYLIPAIKHTLYVSVDQSIVSGRVFSIIIRLLLCMFALIVILLIFLTLLYRPLISSMNELAKFMKLISAGDRRIKKDGPSIHQGLIGSSEIEEISMAFRDMLHRTDELNHDIFDTYTRMYELENNNRKTEIAYLRSQINPHFLYNTLTMICGMASEGNTGKIIDVTNALSQIFRYSIKGSEMVTLREEMEIVRSYLMIQECRFEGRFEIDYNVSPDSYDCFIPRMVIQPLVENAIVHGLEKILHPGRLQIGAIRNIKQGYLVIWVYDTGVGMPKEQLEELRSMVRRSPLDMGTPDSFYEGNMGDTSSGTRDHESIGLMNVNSRMVLYYGSDYALTIDSEEHVGTNIQLRVPYHTQLFESGHKAVFKGEDRNVSGNRN
ncbi:sensor histidine kinase [Lachnospiraceae bacterium OttesenSCG-928-D06]|nr:sensor histidine kinase [Lachnospiraceae bacterium OttesenSCG-928-D06]